MKDVFNSIFNGTLIEIKFVNEGILNCKFFLSEQDKKDRKFMFELVKERLKLALLFVILMFVIFKNALK